MIRLIKPAIGMSLLLVLFYNFLVYEAPVSEPNPVSLSVSEKWRDWSVERTVWNQDISMSAVLESNPHFGSEGYKPILKVSLYGENRLRRVVWSSGYASAPELSWTGNTELLIKYEHNHVSSYEPTINVDGIDYSIYLDMDVSKPSHHIGSRDDGWRWKEKEVLKYNEAVTATVELGEHITGGTSPIIRVSLSGLNNEPIEVYSSTEYKASPLISWSESNTLVIAVKEYDLHSYFPTKMIDGELYEIELRKRE